MDTLGKRIQSIRKSKKMTLVDVAADKMTKGMLSLIENDKAQPSIENLQHIAKMLDTEIGSLTAEFPPAKLRSLLDQIHAIQRKNLNNTKVSSQLIIELIKPIEEKLPLCYETSQILLLYMKCFSRTEQYEEGILVAKRSAEIFKEMSLYNEYLQALRCHAICEVALAQYKNAFTVLQEAYELCISDYYSINTDIKISVFYDYAASAFAIGDFDIAKVSIEYLIDTCHTNKAYFDYSNSLRLAASASILFGKMDEVEYYRNLLDRFTLFDQSNESILLSDLFYLIYFDLAVNDPQKVITYGKKLLNNTDVGDLCYFVYLELGKAYYQLNDIPNANAAFNKYDPSFNRILHPIDQAIYNENFAYYALVLNKLGQTDQAKYWATLAYKNSKKIIPFFDNDFIDHTFNDLVK